MTTTPAARLFAKTTPGPNGCIVWTASLSNRGYGRFLFEGKARAAHRVAYELMVASIPAGMVIDHICHNRDLNCAGGSHCLHRRCVNPHHLEPVSQQENIHRSPHRPVNKTHCVKGHEYTPENRAFRRRHNSDVMDYYCRTCHRDRVAEAKARRTAKQEES